MSISGTLRRYGGISIILGDGSVGRLAPGADYCRPHPLLCSAKLVVEIRSPAPVPGDRSPVWLFRRDADHGQDFPQTGEYTQAVVS